MEQTLTERYAAPPAWRRPVTIAAVAVLAAGRRWPGWPGRRSTSRRPRCSRSWSASTWSTSTPSTARIDVRLAVGHDRRDLHGRGPRQRPLDRRRAALHADVGHQPGDGPHRADRHRGGACPAASPTGQDRTAGRLASSSLRSRLWVCHRCLGRLLASGRATTTQPARPSSPARWAHPPPTRRQARTARVSGGVPHDLADPADLRPAHAELEDRRGPVRAEIVERISAARDEGDLKENGGYHAAKDEQGTNEARIRQLEEHARPDATTEPAPDDQTVSAGKVVTYRFAGDDEESFLLGAREIADDRRPTSRSTLPQSPLGAALDRPQGRRDRRLRAAQRQGREDRDRQRGAVRG